MMENIDFTNSQKKKKDPFREKKKELNDLKMYHVRFAPNVKTNTEFVSTGCLFVK